jgi:hypothetical protein
MIWGGWGEVEMGETKEGLFMHDLSFVEFSMVVVCGGSNSIAHS